MTKYDEAEIQRLRGLLREARNFICEPGDEHVVNSLYLAMAEKIDAALAGTADQPDVVRDALTVLDTIDEEGDAHYYSIADHARMILRGTVRTTHQPAAAPCQWCRGTGKVESAQTGQAMPCSCATGPTPECLHNNSLYARGHDGDREIICIKCGTVLRAAGQQTAAVGPIPGTGGRMYLKPCPEKE